jgi:hypothetical protein
MDGGCVGSQRPEGDPAGLAQRDTGRRCKIFLYSCRPLSGFCVNRIGQVVGEIMRAIAQIQQILDQRRCAGSRCATGGRPNFPSPSFVSGRAGIETVSGNLMIFALQMART